MIARAGLLALLPVIALAVYIDGQRYDPEVLDFTKPAGGALLKFFPENSAGLVREGQALAFNKDNLFEYVNGHAEFYISLGFKSLAVMNYRAETGGDGQPSHTADIFDMGSPGSAFGVLTGDNEGAEPVKIGFMGFKNANSVAFIQGSYYVKISTFDKKGNPDNLAAAVLENMKDIKTEMPQFALFPQEGAAADGRGYARSDYMGLDFMKEVFEQRYVRDGAGFTAFTFTPKKGAADFTGKMLSFYREMDTPVAQVQKDGLTGWIVLDKYEGEWTLARKDSGFFGVRGLKDGAARWAFLNEMASAGKTP